MIDMLMDAMPDEAGAKGLENLHVAAAGMVLAGCPGKIHMHIGAQPRHVHQPTAQRRLAPVLEAARPIVEHQIVGGRAGAGKLARRAAIRAPASAQRLRGSLKRCKMGTCTVVAGGSSACRSQITTPWPTRCANTSGHSPP